MLYVQYACTQPKELLDQKYRQTSVVACLGVLSVFAYIIVLYYFKRTSKLKQVDWDIQTITPGDYTVQYEITDQAYNWFLTNVYPSDKNKGISIGASLKTFMKNEI